MPTLDELANSAHLGHNAGDEELIGDPALEFSLPSARGRGNAVPLVVEVLRALNPEDLPLILDRDGVREREGALIPTPSGIARLRASHHALARLIAEGKPGHEVAALTGYSPCYISTIQHDPAFRELVSSYEAEVSQIFVDAQERLKTVGLSALDEIQHRLDEDPAKLAFSQLTEIVELGLVKGQGRGGQAQGGQGNSTSGGVQVNVTFVQTEGQTAPAIDITPQREHSR